MLLVITKIQSNYYRTNFYFKTMKNTEGVPYGRGLEAPESSVLSVVLILLAIANIVTNKKTFYCSFVGIFLSLRIINNSLRKNNYADNFIKCQDNALRLAQGARFATFVR